MGGRPLAAIGGKWTWSASGWGGIPHSGLYLDGWKSQDMLSSTDEYFRRHDLSDTPCSAWQPPNWGSPRGTYVFWAGVTTTEANYFCYVTGSGYGNSWNQILENTIAMSGDAVTTLEFDYAYDSEIGYDSSFVEINLPGTGSWSKLPLSGGKRGYSGTGSGHESINVGPWLVVGGGNYSIRFRFDSDGGWSDEDGLNATNCGGLIIDNIKITETTNGVVHFCDAETGDRGWKWQPVQVGPGDWVHLEYNPVVDDPCIPSDPLWCQMGDSVVTMYDVTAPPQIPHRYDQDNWIISPVVSFQGTAGQGLPTHIIQFERFTRLPLNDHVFHRWFVRYYPWDCGFGPRWSPWVNNNTVYYTATKSCGLFTYDVSAYVPACAESAQMAMCCINLCSLDPWWIGCTYVNNTTPYFDNARFGAAGSTLAPTITDTELDRYLDIFPTDGTLNCASTANIGTTSLGPFGESILGDTLVVRGVTCPGFAEMEVWLHFRVAPGPCTNTSDAWFSVYPPETWHAARMDTAQRGPSVTPGVWMSTFHEDDPNYGLASGRWGGERNHIIPNWLLTPGSHVDYYVSANYAGGAGSYELRCQEPGYTDLPDDIDVLPGTTVTGGVPEVPCFLYADHCDCRGVQRWIEDALSCIPAKWDRYDRRAPSSNTGDGIGRRSGGQKGATLLQLQGYSSVLLDAGTIYTGSVDQYDTNLFTGFLSGATASQPRFLALQGNQIARYMNSLAAPKAFMNNYLQAKYVARYYHVTSGNQNWCVNMTNRPGNRIDGGAILTESALGGNMCPNEFNIIDVQTGSATGKGEIEFSDATPTVHLCCVSNEVKDSNDNVLYRTVLSSYTEAAVRSVNCPGGARGWQFGDSTGVCGSPVPKGWQDDIYNKFAFGGGTTTCAKLPTDITRPGTVNVASPAYNALKDAYPNPMSPSATISFSVKTDGKVSLRVFDASGRLVRTLIDSKLKAGGHTVAWDGKNDRGVRLGSGVYFYQIETECGFKSTKKIVILR
ncbi:MAG: FlgD immunoglobulin-like domain containing protein [Candidatus Eisenbacteria bacterium]|nr:FlgD immunoglobulin-like domain containing protein [Candidatus Eisenbacteria bacterium]